MAALFRSQPPDRFVGFGRAILAPVSGTVHAVHDGEPDHAAFRGFPSIGYAVTQAGRVRAGWLGLAGNHVVIERLGVFVALCHLRCGSVGVHPGQRVVPGDVIGGCGNSGNSTEPHLHVQAMDGPDPGRAAAVPISFPGGLPRNGTVVSG
jgi:murein DD-endopeptidase MepM/ murein hydrolase activator NlpD